MTNVKTELTPEECRVLMNKEILKFKKSFIKATKDFDKKSQWLLYCRTINLLFALCYSPSLEFAFMKLNDQGEE